MGFHDTVELLLCAAGNVHLCSVVDKCLCAHQADSRAATGNQSDFALDRKQGLQLELVVVGLGRHVGAVSGKCGDVVVELSDSVDRMTCARHATTAKGTYSSSSLIASSMI